MASKYALSGTYSYLMKTYYTPDFIEDYIYKNNEVLKRVYAGRQAANSKDIYTPIRVRRASGSTSAIAETGTEPTAAEPVDYRCTDSVKIIDTHKEISQLVINLTKNGKYNYRTALDDLNSDAMGEHGDFLNRSLFNDNGYLAICASASGQVITLGTGSNMRQFYVGQAVSVLLSADGTTDDGVASTTITAINKSTPSITVDDALSSAAGIDSTHSVCALGNVSGTTNLLPHGLPYLINDNATGTVCGVDCATYTEFRSFVKDGASGSLDLEMMQEVIDEIELESHGKVDLILCSDKLMRKYQYDIIEPQTMRPIGASEYGVGGTGAMYFRGRSKELIPIMVAAYCNPTDDMYFLDLSALKTYHGAWMEWMDDDGKYIRKVATKYVYECSLSSEFQIIPAARTRLAKIKDISLT